MDKNIHSHTHAMGEKWIFLLMMNIDNSDKLCQNFVEMEKLSPPPLQPSISMEKLQSKGKLGKRNNV